MGRRDPKRIRAGVGASVSSRSPCAAGVAAGILLLTMACGNSTVTGNDGAEPDSDVVSSVTLEPAPGVVLIGYPRAFTATARTVRGKVISGVTFKWRSDGPSIASVDGAGTVTGHARGSTRIHVSTAGKTASADVTVRMGFRAASAGELHACGIDAIGVPWCWAVELGAIGPLSPVEGVDVELTPSRGHLISLVGFPRFGGQLGGAE